MLNTETGFVCEFVYYNEGSYEHPEYILQSCTHPVCISHIASLIPHFDTAICDSDYELKDDVYYDLTLTEHDDGTHDNPNVWYEVFAREKESVK